MSTPSVSRAQQRASPSPAPKSVPTRSTLAPRPTPPSARSRRTDASANGDGTARPSQKDNFEAALKRETDEKDNLLVRLDGLTKQHADLSAANDSLRSALQGAESRVSSVYADQLRMESELASRSDVIDKLGEQLQHAEREMRDAERRYREQSAAFDAERQAYYDNEVHLKGRIDHLQEQLKRMEAKIAIAAPVEVASSPEDESEALTPRIPQQPRVEVKEVKDSAELASLRLELESLSDAYGSLQTTHQISQQELADLKRVNQQVQEENESYNVLLRERTLNGTFSLSSAMGRYSPEGSLGDDESWTKSVGRNLEVVAEDAEFDADGEESLGLSREASRPDVEGVSPAPSIHSERSRRRGQQARARRPSPGAERAMPETLAGLPLTGPGLDLAAELGRAEHGMDPLEFLPPPKTEEEAPAIASLKGEIKALKDANKALSLYADKIVDRIVREGGYLHVLSADYGKSEGVANPPARGASLSRAKTVGSHGPRPTSRVAPVTMSGARDQQQELLPNAPGVAQSNSDPARPMSGSSQAKRRSFSIDLRGLWGGGSAPPDKKMENLRPLSLAASAAPPPAAPPTFFHQRPRIMHIDTEEDEEDRKERDRLNATMKLLGIEGASSFRTREQQAEDLSHLERPPNGTSGAKADRRKTALYDASSPLPGQQQRAYSSPFSYSRPTSEDPSRPGLTAEALAESSAAHAIAELDAHEKALAEQIAKGAAKGYQGGFTPSPRDTDASGSGGSLNGGGGSVMRRAASRRRERASGGTTLSVGSVSTVWSAGRASGSFEEEVD